MSSDGYFDGWKIQSKAIECAVADFMAMVRRTAEATSSDEYDIRVGVEWTGKESLSISTIDDFGFSYNGASVPLHRYTPVEVTVNATESDLDFYWRVHDLAEDCVNQGGISNLQMIHPPKRDAQETP